jgi:hypothetical protein
MSVYDEPPHAVLRKLAEPTVAGLIAYDGPVASKDAGRL